MIKEFRLVSGKCYKRKIRVGSGKVRVRVRGKFLIIKATVSGFDDLIRGCHSHKVNLLDVRLKYCGYHVIVI